MRVENWGLLDDDCDGKRVRKRRDKTERHAGRTNNRLASAYPEQLNHHPVTPLTPNLHAQVVYTRRRKHS